MTSPCDVAIVGAGAAGSILAARISQDPCCRVVLIEAGRDTPPGSVPDDISDTFPAAYSNPDYFWPGLQAIARTGVAAAPFPQARVMGGGSAVMGMWALRGMPGDYDAWRAAGASGWGWSDVLPFFRRLETDRDFKGTLHGDNGPIVVRRHSPDQWPPFVRMLAAAAAKDGLHYRDDINGDLRDGIFAVPVTNDETGRTSSSSGYLTDAVRQRPNLAILAETEVLRIILSGRSVQGLELLGRSGKTTLACREAVLSAGAIGSPALLLRSGIGAGAALKGLGIQPVLDLPGVGERLQNHCVVNFATRISPGARQSPALRTYGLACGRLSSGHPNGKRGDLHLQFITRTSLNPHGDLIGLVGAALFSPLSRGRVSLASGDPRVSPLIEFRLLSDDADRDRMAMVASAAMKLLADEAVRALRDGVFTLVPASLVRRVNRPDRMNRTMSGLLALALEAPGPVRRMIARQAGRMIDEPALAEARGESVLSDVSPIFHPTGTCAMGPAADRLAVLDSACRVRGISGLRVVDASVMPVIPSGNTCLPTMMVAERAAELISANNV